jgi:hypothetical protein
LTVAPDSRQPRLEIRHPVNIAVKDRSRRAIDQTVRSPPRDPIRAVRLDRDAHPTGSQAQAVELALRFASHT